MALKVKKKFPVPYTTRPHHTLPQRTLKKEQRKRTAHRTLNTALVLSVLAVGAGIAYTWYMGQNKPVAADTAATTVRHGPPVIKPAKVASDAPLGVAVQMVTSTARAGENASITIRTNPEAECAITVKYGTILAKDSGLTTKLSDEFGVASWAWTIAAGTPPGKSPIEVACKNKKHSAVVKTEMIISV